MRKTTLIIYLVFLLPFIGKSQGVKEFSIGVSGIAINSQKFGGGSNFGRGIHGSYRFGLWSKYEINSVTQIGFDFVPRCNNPADCPTRWYQRSVRMNTFLEKELLEKNGHILDFGLGAGLFFGNRLYATSELIRNGSLVSSSNSYRNNLSYSVGSQISYTNLKFSERFRLTYGLDLLWRRTINTLSINYRIN